MDVVKELLAAKAEVNAKDNSSTTALIAASANGRLDVVKELLAAKADVNAENKYSITAALITASANGHLDVVKELIAAGANVNDRANCDLEFITKKGWVRITTTTTRVICNNATALLIASNEGELEVVKALLVVGADVNILGGLGIYWRLSSPENWVCGRFNGMPHGMPPCTSHPNLFEDSEIESEMRMEAANLKTPLMVASQQGYVKTVKALLAAKADVNIKSSKGETALMMAQQNGHEDIVRLLELAGTKK